MRIVTWNLNHQERDQFKDPQRYRRTLRAISYLNPDILVLTEYVKGVHNCDFLRELGLLGLTSSLLSPKWPGKPGSSRDNRVLIAARESIASGHLQPPQDTAYLLSNILHVQLPVVGVEVLGLRVPFYEHRDLKEQKPYLKRRTWDWIKETAKELKERQAIMIGDFNGSLERTSRIRSDSYDREVKSLFNELWTPVHVSGYSFWGRNGNASQLDYALVSRAWKATAQYVVEADGHVFAHKGSKSEPDHAALVVDVVLAC